jgi:excisionase family DNA binding protein
MMTTGPLRDIGLMPATKTKSRSASKPNGAAREASPSSDVLTLSEVASYLRVPEEAVLRAIAPGGLPARLIDGEWRFFKPALQDWLRTEPKPSSREALASAAGAWKDDPTVDVMLKEIYRRRGRPMTEDGE